MSVRIRLLGEVELTDGATLGGDKPRRLLTVLASRPGEVVPTDQLVDVLWPETPPADPTRSLQVHVSNLRRTLDGSGLDAGVEHRGRGYALQVEPSVVDVSRFESLVADGLARSDDDPTAAAQLLRDALALWKGPPFGDLADHPALRAERARLEDLRLRALEARIDADLAAGRHSELTGELQQLVEQHPLREQFAAQLMLALYRTGRQAEALETFEATRRRLAEELGVDPSPALRELHQQMLRQDPGLDAPAPPRRDPDPAQATAAGAPDARTVAVLPFDLIGGADDAEFLAMGLHNDLLTELSKVPALTIICRTSVLGYRGADRSIPAIAHELNAGTVVEGTVQQAGDRFRLTVQLIDGLSDVQRWAESYDRELTTADLFAIQSELARDIARSLHAELAGAQRRTARRPATGSLEAYRLATEGREQFDLKTEEGFRHAIERYEQAVELDPEYVDAWVGLAEALASMEAYGHGDREVLLPRARRAVQRALALDPESASARTSLGMLHASDQDGPAALREFERAIRAHPSDADAHNWHSWISLLVGDAATGLDSALRAAELDPLSAEAHAHVALGYAATGRPDQGVLSARRARRASPYTTAEFYEGLCLQELGRFDEACEVLEPLTVRGGGELGVPWAGHGPDVVFALALAGRGDGDGARAVLDGIDAEAHPFAAGLIQLGLDEVDYAVRSFEAVDLLSDWPCLAVHHYHDEVWATLGSSDTHEALVERALASWHAEFGPTAGAATTR